MHTTYIRDLAPDDRSGIYSTNASGYYNTRYNCQGESPEINSQPALRTTVCSSLIKIRPSVRLSDGGCVRVIEKSRLDGIERRKTKERVNKWKRN